MKVRLVTAGVGAAWEAALVQACQAGQVGAQVLHRCYDLGDLLAVAAAGQAEVAVVAAGTRWLDRDALARLAAAGLAVVGVAGAGDEDGERRLRQLGLLHVAVDTDPPEALVDRARAALSAEADPAGPLHPDGQPLHSTGEPLDPAGMPLHIAGEPFDPAGGLPGPGQVPAQPDDGGRRALAAVWGPKGGPGRTTVAVNLAFEAAAAGGEVLLVDADTYGGAVAQTLGFLDDAPGLGWAARVAGRGELDALRLRQSVRRAAPGGPRILPGLPRAELWTEVRPGTWEALLELFRVAFPVTVVDAGFCLEEDEELLYDQLRPGMFGGDRPAEQVRVALSRYVGIEPSAVVLYDRQGIDAALLAGQALREARPGSPAQVALARLAAVLFPAQTSPSRRSRRRSRAAGHAVVSAGPGP